VVGKGPTDPRDKPEDDGKNRTLTRHEGGMTGYVYMMSDKPRGVIYTGVTSDLQQRSLDHRNAVREGFTSRYKAKNLVWFESHPNIVLAIQREKSLKRYLRDWKIQLIEGLNPAWLDLFERIWDIENVYHPHPNTKKWNDYN
jgi:putative endonuclease